MAKTLSMKANPDKPIGGLTKAQLQDRVRELENTAPQLIAVSDIKVGPPFDQMFKLDSDGYEKIITSITEHGYDENFPILVWWTDTGSYILLDGHRRLTGAKKAGIDTIPAKLAQFESEADALKYAWHIQFDRRNMSDADLLYWYINADPDTIEASASTGRFKTKLANLLNLRNEKKAMQIITIANKGDDPIQQQVLNGELSINAAYELIKEPERPAKAEESPGQDADDNYAPPAAFTTAGSNEPAADFDAEDGDEDDLDLDLGGNFDEDEIEDADHIPFGGGTVTKPSTEEQESAPEKPSQKPSTPRSAASPPTTNQPDTDDDDTSLFDPADSPDDDVEAELESLDEEPEDIEDTPETGPRNASQRREEAPHAAFSVALDSLSNIANRYEVRGYLLELAANLHADGLLTNDQAAYLRENL